MQDLLQCENGAHKEKINRQSMAARWVFKMTVSQALMQKRRNVVHCHLV